MSRFDDEIARLERDARSGAPGPDALLRLSRAYLRAGRADDAQAALVEARAVLSPLVRDASGRVAGLDPRWEELQRELTEAGALTARRARADRRAQLTRRLEAGPLAPGEHDELIRLEVQDRVAIHPEPPRCPGCLGAVVPAPAAREPADPTDAAGAATRGARGDWVRCARSGRDGDLCRHVNASGILACGGCGLVVRAWRHGKLPSDPHEPPLATPEKARCRLCGARVADWSKHFLRCPRGRPADFPACAICRRRGFHERALRCPRCAEEVGAVRCLERERP